MNELILTKRIKTTSNVTRKENGKGKIAGVIYGKEMGSELFYVDAIALRKELSVSGEHGVLTFDMDGKKGTALIKQVQKNAFGHQVIHIDLEEIAANAIMHTEISIKVIGKGELENKGLMLQTQRDLVKVSCTANNLPKDVELDVSEGEAGTVYTLEDLKLGKDVEFVDDLSTVISSVSEDEKQEEEVKEVEEETK